MDVAFIPTLALFPRKRIWAAWKISRAPGSGAEKVKAGLKPVFLGNDCYGPRTKLWCGLFMGVESEQKGTLCGSGLCELGEILIWAMLWPLLAVPQGGCVHLENPCPWGPCMVPGAVGVLEGVSCLGRWDFHLHGRTAEACSHNPTTCPALNMPLLLLLPHEEKSYKPLGPPVNPHLPPKSHCFATYLWKRVWLHSIGFISGIKAKVCWSRIFSTCL